VVEVRTDCVSQLDLVEAGRLLRLYQVLLLKVFILLHRRSHNDSPTSRFYSMTFMACDWMAWS